MSRFLPSSAVFADSTATPDTSAAADSTIKFRFEEPHGETREDIAEVLEELERKIAAARKKILELAARDR